MLSKERYVSSCHSTKDNFSSLTGDEFSMVLLHPVPAPAVYGMDVIRGGLANLAHSVACDEFRTMP